MGRHSNHRLKGARDWGTGRGHAHLPQGMMMSACFLLGATKVSKAGFTNFVYCSMTPAMSLPLSATSRCILHHRHACLSGMTFCQGKDASESPRCFPCEQRAISRNFSHMLCFTELPDCASINPLTLMRCESAWAAAHLLASRRSSSVSTNIFMFSSERISSMCSTRMPSTMTTSAGSTLLTSADRSCNVKS